MYNDSLERYELNSNGLGLKLGNILGGVGGAVIGGIGGYLVGGSTSTGQMEGAGAGALLGGVIGSSKKPIQKLEAVTVAAATGYITSGASPLGALLAGTVRSFSGGSVFGQTTFGEGAGAGVIAGIAGPTLGKAIGLSQSLTGPTFTNPLSKMYQSLDTSLGLTPSSAPGTSYAGLNLGSGTTPGSPTTGSGQYQILSGSDPRIGNYLEAGTGDPSKYYVLDTKADALIGPGDNATSFSSLQQAQTAINPNSVVVGTNPITGDPVYGTTGGPNIPGAAGTPSSSGGILSTIGSGLSKLLGLGGGLLGGLLGGQTQQGAYYDPNLAAEQAAAALAAQQASSAIQPSGSVGSYGGGG